MLKKRGGIFYAGKQVNESSKDSAPCGVRNAYGARRGADTTANLPSILFACFR